MNDNLPPLPNLELLGKLGEGGMSTVWKANDLLRGEVVAVKILNRDLTASDEDIALFKAEARTMSEIQHVGIVRSYDINCHEGIWYYTMEYVDGYNFNALLSRKQHLQESDCLLICESIAVALDYAWNNFGVVHCDIKPDNIMINTDGIVKLTDLGLCHTFQYLKDGMKDIPDHVTEPDCRADIYSLAASLYHLSTGRMLFPGFGNEDMMRAHCDESTQAKDPRFYRPELSEGFCQLLEAMLVKNRDYRLPSWKDVCEMCLAVEQGVAFKPRKGPASSLRLELSELAPVEAEDESEEPTELMQVPEPKKRMMHFFTGGGKHRREPQIQIDPESGKKILRKPKVVNNFKVHHPVTDW